jgi:glycosyltransferase involved in cell wall biosynthesis
MVIEVSVVTPTYNRRQFIPALITIYNNQTYPKDKMEWIIIDDGRDKVKDLFEEASKYIPNIKYIAKDEKMRLGAKRNALNAEARGKIIVAMDDDDFYPPDRVQSVVEAFDKNPKIDLAGSSIMNLYYIDSGKIFRVGPYHKNHATNGTMAWRKKYSDTHKYDEYVTKAEETSFLDRYQNPMIQIDHLKTILVICHTDNTVDKSQFRDRNLLALQTGQAITNFRETNYKLSDLVKDSTLLEFYKSLQLPKE